MNYTGRSVAELLGLPASTAKGAVSDAVTERWRLLGTPISQLSAEGVWQLLKTGVGEQFLVEPAIGYLEGDHTQFGLLTSLLRVREFLWADHPDCVRRLRAIVGRALAELSEWDGTAETAISAMRQRIPILEEWAVFEQSLSRISK